MVDYIGYAQSAKSHPHPVSQLYHTVKTGKANACFPSLPRSWGITLRRNSGPWDEDPGEALAFLIKRNSRSSVPVVFSSCLELWVTVNWGRLLGATRKQPRIVLRLPLTALCHWIHTRSHLPPDLRKKPTFVHATINRFVTYLNTLSFFNKHTQSGGS